MNMKNLENLGKKYHFKNLLHIVIITIIIMSTSYVLMNSADNANSEKKLFKNLEIHMEKEEIQLDSINKRIDSITWETNSLK